MEPKEKRWFIGIVVLCAVIGASLGLLKGHSVTHVLFPTAGLVYGLFGVVIGIIIFGLYKIIKRLGK